MSSAGSVLAMIISLKNNARPRYKAFERAKERQKDSTFGNIKLQFKTVPEDQLQAIKEKIRLDARRQRRRYTIMLCSISFLILGVGTYYFVSYFKNYKAEVNFAAKERLEIEKILDEKYMFFINDGYKWLEKGHYKKAKFQFYEAYKIKPKEFTTELANTKVYLLDCSQNGISCKNALKYIRILQKKYPDDPEVLSLTEMYGDQLNINP